jgi:hypothetical protein
MQFIVYRRGILNGGPNGENVGRWGDSHIFKFMKGSEIPGLIGGPFGIIWEGYSFLLFTFFLKFYLFYR